MMKFMLSLTCLSLILSVGCTQTIQKEGDAVVVIPADNSRLFWKWQGESGGSWGVQEGTREDLEEYREKFQEEMSDNPLGLGFGLGIIDRFIDVVDEIESSENVTGDSNNSD